MDILCIKLWPSQSQLTCACAIKACVLAFITSCAILLFRSRWAFSRVTRTFTVLLTTSTHNIRVSFQANNASRSVVTCTLFTASTGLLTAFTSINEFSPSVSKFQIIILCLGVLIIMLCQLLFSHPSPSIAYSNLKLDYLQRAPSLRVQLVVQQGSFLWHSARSSTLPQSHSSSPSMMPLPHSCCFGPTYYGILTTTSN